LISLICKFWISLWQAHQDFHNLQWCFTWTKFPPSQRYCSSVSNLLAADILVKTQFLKLHLNWSDLLCRWIEPWDHSWLQMSAVTIPFWKDFSQTPWVNKSTMDNSQILLQFFHTPIVSIDFDCNSHPLLSVKFYCNSFRPNSFFLLLLTSNNLVWIPHIFLTLLNV
jgi:hypothetical protein